MQLERGVGLGAKCVSSPLVLVVGAEQPRLGLKTCCDQSKNKGPGHRFLIKSDALAFDAAEKIILRSAVAEHRPRPPAKLPLDRRNAQLRPRLIDASGKDGGEEREVCGSHGQVSLRVMRTRIAWP